MIPVNDPASISQGLALSFLSSHWPSKKPASTDTTSSVPAPMANAHGLVSPFESSFGGSVGLTGMHDTLPDLILQITEIGVNFPRSSGPRPLALESRCRSAQA